MSSFFDIASKVLNAGAISEGKILLSKPVGEHIPFTRAGGGSTTLQNGTIIEQAANWPAIVKRDGECSLFAWRPAQTRLFTQPNNLAHTDWVKQAIGTGVAPIATANYAMDPMGGNNACRIQLNTGAGGSSSDQSYIRQTFSIVSGSSYTMGFWLKSNTGSNQTIQLLRESANLVTIVVTNEWKFFTTTKVGASTSLSNWGLFLSGSVAAAADILVFAANMVVGTYIPSVILGNDAGTQTRNADSSTNTGLKASGFIGNETGAIGGTLLAKSLIRESSSASLTIGDTGNSFYILRDSVMASRMSFKYDAGAGGALAHTTVQDQNKWLFTWDKSPDINGDRWILSVNGVKVASGPEVFSFPTDTLTMSGVAGYWEGAPEIFSQVRLSEDAANAYTTL
ncbi:MAG: hypothetical protein EP346_00115 [Bacteroidetes bacterium]|nr:MAG: hypothetical protein EP346_00115 [Bacteroidota bacterium]